MEGFLYNCDGIRPARRLRRDWWFRRRETHLAKKDCSFRGLRRLCPRGATAVEAAALDLRRALQSCRRCGVTTRNSLAGMTIFALTLVWVIALVTYEAKTPRPANASSDAMSNRGGGGFPFNDFGSGPGGPPGDFNGPGGGGPARGGSGNAGPARKGGGGPARCWPRSSCFTPTPTRRGS